MSELQQSEKLEVRVDICPYCAEPVYPWVTEWLWNGKFYCSEACSRKAAENK